MRTWYVWTIGLLAVFGAAGWIAAALPAQTAPPAAQETPPAEPARKTPLETLDWLVGDWVDNSDEITAEFSCHFTKNNAFLVRSFRIVTKKGVSLSGMQVIAWDPARETIRSWTYDSNGGFGEETWTQSGAQYTIRAKYTLPDGGTASALHIMSHQSDDQFTWRSVNREIDGELQPDVEEVTIVRKHTGDASKGGN